MKYLSFCITIASCLIATTALGMDISFDRKRSATDAQLTESDRTKKVRKWLFSALEERQTPVVKAILRFMPDIINAQNEYVETPLFDAVRHNLDSVELLLKHGCCVNFQNNAGMTPLLFMASLWFCEDYINQEDSDDLQDDFFPGNFVGSKEEHFKEIISTAKLLMESGTDTSLINENDDTVITLLSSPCGSDHETQGNICENCGVNHACHTCTTSHQLLGTIQEQLAYRKQAPQTIKTALEECHTADWASLSPIIAGYLTAIAPLPQKITLAPLDTPDSMKLGLDEE